MSPLPRRIAPLAVAVAFAVALVRPADSTPAQAPGTQVWIDVATHNMANMPELGGMERFAMRMMGGSRSKPSFPTTKHPGATGQYMDVAIHNRLKPGKQAEDDTPDGLGVGTLVLLPPPAGEDRVGDSPSDPPDVEITVREYWGCGGVVGPGQPRVSTYTVKGGVASQGGDLMQSKYAPPRDVQPTPAYALWPNKIHGVNVPDGASLAGTHRFSGDGIPASLRFELDRNADFMPKIALTRLGEGDAPIQLSWMPVERARAYFLQATQMDGASKPDANRLSVTMWSSAETGGAGASLVDYLDASYLDRWLKQKILLPASVHSCLVPQGIFATGKGPANMTMLNMVAYGPETHLAYPPKPADPKRLAAWKPEWSVRVRTKSTASLVLGMDMAEEGKEKESTGKKLLRGLFRRGQ